MKPREKCSGRGCESPQVHHKDTLRNLGWKEEFKNKQSLINSFMIYFIFIGCCLVFGVSYLSRDKTKDAEKLKNCDLW